ncbi:MAG: S-layer homology domain-containing protein [Candidatus Altimarinota bacterium]
MKKHAFILVVVLILLGISGSAFAKDFSDIPSQHQNAAAVQYLSELEVFRGQGDGQRFDPSLPINRAEWAQTLVRHTRSTPGSFHRDCFFDIFDQWYAAPVCYSAAQGWIKGYQAGPERGFFLPVNTLNMAEILVTLSRVFKWNLIEGEYWYTGAMEYAKNARIISESTVFDQPVTRAQAAEILFRTIALKELQVARYEPFLADLMLQRLPEIQEPSPMPPNEDSSHSIATVVLSPFAEQPAKSTLAKGSWYVPVLRFVLEAQQDTILEEIGVRRIAVGRSQDLSLGRLMINGEVITDGTFSSNVVNWRNLNYPLKAGEPVVVEMNIDFEENATPSLVYQFETAPELITLKDEGGVVTGEKITGKLFSVASLPATQVTIANPDSTLKLPFVESLDQIIGRFQITAGEHDVLIKRIRLEDAEAVNDRNFSNFRLSAGGDVLSTIPVIERNVLDFSVSDYLIQAGRTRTFTVQADIGGARIDDTIRLYLEEPEDIHAFDIEYGFGTRVNNQFSRESAWCVGSKTPQCPAEGLRKRCSKDDREAGVRDCEED